MVGWVHRNSASRHIHLIWGNSTGKRTINITPKFLRKLQSFCWTAEFLSGRGSKTNCGGSFGFYPKAPNLKLHQLVKRLKETGWAALIHNGELKNLRKRNDGSVVSVEFEGQRIRVATINKFMEARLNTSEPVPESVQEELQESGYTSADVQAILTDIREAQGWTQTTQAKEVCIKVVKTIGIV